MLANSQKFYSNRLKNQSQTVFGGFFIDQTLAFLLFWVFKLGQNFSGWGGGAIRITFYLKSRWHDPKNHDPLVLYFLNLYHKFQTLTSASVQT